MGNKRADTVKLYESILKLQSVEECEKFFDDLCTSMEISAMAQRIEVASLLLQKKVYIEIMEQTSASTATISRVKRMLNQGNGCLEEVLLRNSSDEK